MDRKLFFLALVFFLVCVGLLAIGGATYAGTESKGEPPNAGTTSKIEPPTKERVNSMPLPTVTGYSYTTATGAAIEPGTNDIGNHVDDGFTTISLPFPFLLYDTPYTSVNVISNGNLQFTTTSTAFTNVCPLPAATHAESIMPFWDDLLTSTQPACSAFTSGCGVFTSTTGIAPNRVFNIEWRAAFYPAGGTTTANFEVRLYEAAPNRFDFIYGAVEGDGISASIGVQNGTTATTFSCNTANLSTGLRVAFTPQYQGTATPTPCGGGSAGWSAGPDFPSNVVRAVGVYYPGNGRFYTLGGRTSDVAGSDILRPYEYSPATNTWTQKSATFGNNNVNNMAAGVLTIGGQSVILVVGGSPGGGTTTSGEVRTYDPIADTLTVLTQDAWPSGAISSTVPGGFAVYNNKMYILGGFVPTTGSQTMVDTIWEFDPARVAGSRWQKKNARLGTQLGYVPAATIGNFIYTGGGSIWDGITLQDSANSYRYDPVADTITNLPNLPRETGETRAVNMGGNMWVLGGGRTAPNPSDEVRIYNPTTNSWSLGSTFTTARRNFPADVNSGGNAIYMAGGYAPSAPVASMEIYRGGPCTATPTATYTRTFTPTPTNTPAVSYTPASTSTPTITVTPGGPTFTPTTTDTPGGPTRTPTPTIMPTGCVPTRNNYVFATAVATIEAGTNDTGNHCDNCVTPLNLPFPVSFYAQTYNSATLTDNGTLQFGIPDTTYNSSCLPFSSTGATIFAHWDNLYTTSAFGDPCSGCGVFTSTTGTAPNRIFNIQWIAGTQAITGGRANFEIRFYESEGYIDVVYGQVANNGGRATIGVQSHSEGGVIRAVTFSCRTPQSITPNLRIRWTPETFSDVPPDNAFYPFVVDLNCREAISGYADGTFRPGNNTTRAQLCKIIVLAEEWTPVDPPTPTFRDVPRENPFFGFIETAYGHEIISGYECGAGCLEFRPGNNVTRGQLSKIIVLAQEWTLEDPPTPSFRDVPRENPFYGFVETAYAHEIISGYECGASCREFRPGNNATRGQICKIVDQAITQQQWFHK